MPQQVRQCGDWTEAFGSASYSDMKNMTVQELAALVIKQLDALLELIEEVLDEENQRSA